MWEQALFLAVVVLFCVSVWRSGRRSDFRERSTGLQADPIRRCYQQSGSY